MDDFALFGCSSESSSDSVDDHEEADTQGTGRQPSAHRTNVTRSRRACLPQAVPWSGSHRKKVLLRRAREAYPTTSNARGPHSILKARAMLRTRGAADGPNSVVVALDTCCNVSIFAPGYATHVSDDMNMTSASTFGGANVPLGKPSILKIVLADGKEVHITGVEARDQKHLPAGTMALLSKDACTRLDVDMNWHCYCAPVLFPADIPQLRTRAESAQICGTPHRPKFF